MEKLAPPPEYHFKRKSGQVRRHFRRDIWKVNPAGSSRILREEAVRITYYAALPFVRTEDGSAPGQANHRSSSYGQAKNRVRNNQPSNAPTRKLFESTLGVDMGVEFRHCNRGVERAFGRRAAK